MKAKIYIPIQTMVLALLIPALSIETVLAQNWSIVTTYTIPGKASGLAWDSTYNYYDAGTPEIQIPVTNHNFGTITVGSTATWNMTVNSTGTAPLQVTGITFPYGFPVSTPTTFPLTIPSGQSAQIPLIYSPTTAGPLNGIIQVNSNSLLIPSVNVTITGNAVFVGPNLHVPVSSFDFENRRLNSTTRWHMQVQNNGNATLTINALEFSNDDFYTDGAVALPLNLPTMATATFNVWFKPQSAMVYNETLSIFSNDTQPDPFVVNLSGSASSQAYPVGYMLWHFNITGALQPTPNAITWIPDVTGDGIADVIVSSKKWFHPALGRPHYDVYGDGITDVVVGSEDNDFRCFKDNYVRFFNGNASGPADMIWERVIHSGAVYSHKSISIIADINTDGYPDIIIGTAEGDRAVVALSGKTGVVLWRYQTNQFGLGGNIYQVDAKYDFNGDGFPDVLAASGNDENNLGPRRVFCLNGKNGSVLWTTFLNDDVTAVIGIPDVTGDGIPDVVAGGPNPQGTLGRAYGINGANGSLLWHFITTGNAVFALQVVDDITNDGKPEVAIGSNGGTIYLVNPVNGSILHTASIGNHIITNLVRLDDINGDGVSDIFPGNNGTLALALDGTNLTTIWSQSIPDKPWNVDRIPDITGDSINDIVIGTLNLSNFQSNYVYLLDGTSGNTIFSVDFNAPVEAISPIPDIVGDHSWEFVAGGFNGTLVCFSGGINAPTGIRPATQQTGLLNFESTPNPFSDHTTLYFYLPADGITTIRIYDLNATVVFRKNFGRLPAGNHTFRWDGRNMSGVKLPAGMFITELESYGKTKRTKLIHMGE